MNPPGGASPFFRAAVSSVDETDTVLWKTAALALLAEGEKKEKKRWSGSKRYERIPGLNRYQRWY